MLRNAERDSVGWSESAFRAFNVLLFEFIFMFCSILLSFSFSFSVSMEWTQIADVLFTLNIFQMNMVCDGVISMKGYNDLAHNVCAESALSDGKLFEKFRKFGAVAVTHTMYTCLSINQIHNAAKLILRTHFSFD